MYISVKSFNGENKNFFLLRFENFIGEYEDEIKIIFL